MNLDPTLLQPTSLIGYVLVFLGGVLTSIGPCNVAMIPLIVGVIGGSTQITRRQAFTISFVFATGLAITFVLLGVAAALIGGLLGGTTRFWYYLVAAVCFFIGLQMLGVFQFTLPDWFGSLREKVTARGLSGALLLGLVSGLVASQCATPVLAAILTYVMAEKTGLLYGALLLFIYAMGRGVPIVLAGTFTGVLKGLRAMAPYASSLEKIAGTILIGVGLYFLYIA
ncbi:cytochrome c biogenesis protein CcdA [uncultured Thermanaerothrix sp.]|uniref:cytochrome c biogenesis CcdA family protein n=1 Tax=uncultured Thermanaerothrix sp. TaxID=1195149 RepID=UPI0026377B99|nr:cytochrome c biogenesis protein CcdA [uncultured Thermanaerothrix sp.]